MATQTQNNLTDDEVSTIRALLSAIPSQAGAQGTTAGVANVPQGSSPEISADAAQSISGGPTQNGGNGMQGNQTQQQPQPNAYQKGVNKMLLQAGQQHAQQAIQAGIDPNAIAAHPAMQLAQQAAVSNLVAAAPKQTQVPTGQAQEQVQQPVDINAQIDNINKQAALNIAKRNLQASQPQSFLQRFSQQFAKMEGGVTQQEELANNQTIQAIAGGTPIQPKDVADLNARSYAAAMDAAHNGVTAEAQKLTALEDLYSKEQPNRSIADVMQSRESGNQSFIRQNIENSAENISKHLKNLRTLIHNRPTFSTQGINPQTQNIVNKIQEGQTATNPKTKQRIVFRGGKWLNLQ